MNVPLALVIGAMCVFRPGPGLANSGSDDNVIVSTNDRTGVPWTAGTFVARPSQVGETVAVDFQGGGPEPMATLTLRIGARAFDLVKLLPRYTRVYPTHVAISITGGEYSHYTIFLLMPFEPDRQTGESPTTTDSCRYLEVQVASDRVITARTHSAPQQRCAL